MSGNMATNIGYLFYSFMLYFLRSGHHSYEEGFARMRTAIWAFF